MQLKITWMLEDENNEKKRVDLLVPDGQKIADTIKVLEEAGYIDEDNLKAITYVRSNRTARLVNISDTYKIGHIYNGDILEIVSH